MKRPRSIRIVRVAILRPIRKLPQLVHRLSPRQMMLVLGAVVGVIAGFATYLFKLLLGGIEDGLTSWFPAGEVGYLYLLYPVVGIILASLWVRYYVKDDISEGVTRVLYAISKRSSRIKSHNNYTSLVGGAITIGFGGSVGPEAPIVLTGSSIGSNIARYMRLNYRQTTLLLGCGAAAAVSAIFKAPIAGLVFVLEVLMLDMSMVAIVPLLIASATGAALSFFLNGFDPILSVGVVSIKLANIPYYLVLAVVCGFVSYYFTSINSRIAARFRRMKTPYQKWLWGGIALGVLIFLFPPLYGEGFGAIHSIATNNTGAMFENSLFYSWQGTTWVVLLIIAGLIVFKVVAMAVTNAAGGVGGTFAPSLFVGAFTGAGVATLLNAYFGTDISVVNFALVGMAGVMAGVMKAPLTSIFLIAEISSGYGLFVPLMIVASVSFAISYYFEPDSIYTKKLRAQGELVTHDKDRSVMVFLDINKLMERDFNPVKPDTTLGELVSLISTAKRNVFPVLSEGGGLLGIVQLDDFRADMFNREKWDNKVESYMIPPPDIIVSNERADSVLADFDRTGAWNLPVVDTEGIYQGFISKSRILGAYRTKLKELSEE